MLVDGDGELDFLDDDDLLLLAGCALALVLLVKELAVVLNAADGRDGVGGNLNQIQAAFAGNFQGFKRCEDAELLTGVVDDADFTRANSFIDADKLLGRTLIDGFPPKFVAMAPCTYSVYRASVSFDAKERVRGSRIRGLQARLRRTRR